MLRSAAVWSTPLAAMRARRTDELDNGGVDEGLAAREPDLPDAGADKGGGQAHNLVVAEQVVLGRELDALGRHAVRACAAKAEGAGGVRGRRGKACAPRGQAERQALGRGDGWRRG